MQFLTCSGELWSVVSSSAALSPPSSKMAPICIDLVPKGADHGWALSATYGRNLDTLLSYINIIINIYFLFQHIYEFG